LKISVTGLKLMNQVVQPFRCYVRLNAWSANDFQK